MDILLHVKNDNLVELKKYLQYNSMNIFDENKRGLLHYATIGRANLCINTLIDFGINVEHKDVLGQTAIFDAAIKGNLGVLKILIRKNCDVNVQDNYGNIPLFYAIKTNNKPVVDLLFDKSSNNIRNNNKEDASLIAIKYNYHNLNKFITTDDICDANNDTLLHYAAKYNNLNLVKQFINRYNVNKKNNNNETVFFYAVKYSNRDIVRYLIKYLPVIDIKNKYSESLLEQVKNNHYDITDLIENYISSLEFIYYKQNNAHIYNYLCNDNIFDISNVTRNKKDNFSLSLFDYVNYNNDKINLKKLNK